MKSNVEKKSHELTAREMIVSLEKHLSQTTIGSKIGCSCTSVQNWKFERSYPRIAFRENLRKLYESYL